MIVSFLVTVMSVDLKSIDSKRPYFNWNGQSVWTEQFKKNLNEIAINQSFRNPNYSFFFTDKRETATEEAPSDVKSEVGSSPVPPKMDTTSSSESEKAASSDSSEEKSDSSSSSSESESSSSEDESEEEAKGESSASEKEEEKAEAAVEESADEAEK